MVAVVMGFLKIRHSEVNKISKGRQTHCNIYFIYYLRKVAKKIIKVKNRKAVVTNLSRIWKQHKCYLNQLKPRMFYYPVRKEWCEFYDQNG